MVVDIPQQAAGEWESSGHPGQAVFESRYVTRYLPDIVNGNPRSFLKLEQQQV